VPDTVVPVQPGDTLVVETLSGSLRVRGAEGSELRVIHDAGGSDGVEVRRRGGRVRLGSVGVARGSRQEVELRIPRGMPVEVRGSELEVDVEGVEAPVSVRTVDGDVEIQGAVGQVRARSVEGSVTVVEVEGPVTATTVDDDVTVAEVSGPVSAETTDGDVRLRNVSGPRIHGQTVDGDVAFEGALAAGGRTTLITHDGSLRVGLPRGTDARVSVSTYGGSFESEFPVTVERLSGSGEMSFVLGTGSAELILQAFDGEIGLRWIEGAGMPDRSPGGRP
jgi:DUF4097 and DUF4098 domain-containing protein YvlB